MSASNAAEILSAGQQASTSDLLAQVLNSVNLSSIDALRQKVAERKSDTERNNRAHTLLTAIGMQTIPRRAPFARFRGGVNHS